VPETHPNDLTAGETAKFALMLDGKPAAGVTIAIAPGGKRYRDDLKELQLKSDAEGKFTVQFPEAGMYWLNAIVGGEGRANPGEGNRASYIVTLEVLPQ